MNKKFFNALASLLYLSVTLLAGLLHDHHEHAGPLGDDHCAACHFQLAVATDVPAPVITTVTAESAVVVPPPAIVVRTTVLDPLTASRAPPVATT